MSKETKTYAPGLFIRSHVFRDGGEILKLSIGVDQFAEFLRAQRGDDGYARLVISRRREVGKNGLTHTCYVDTYKPKPRDDGRPAEPMNPPAEPASDDVLPF